jgi:hypothetical protein
VCPPCSCKYTILPFTSRFYSSSHRVFKFSHKLVQEDNRQHSHFYATSGEKYGEVIHVVLRARMKKTTFHIDRRPIFVGVSRRKLSAYAHLPAHPEHSATPTRNHGSIRLLRVIHRNCLGRTLPARASVDIFDIGITSAHWGESW